MKPAIFLTAAALGLAAPASAHASSMLDLNVTADNQFSIYLSNDNSVLGTLIGSGNTWQSSYNFSVALLPGNNYIQVIGTNWTPENGLWSSPGTPNGTGDNPNAFLGSFNIVGSGYVFANSTTTMSTNPTDWSGIPVTSATWVLPTGPTQSFGLNGGSNIWASVLGGPVLGISTSADWIWSLPDNAQYADLSAEIFNTSESRAAPLPAALPLFATGLGLMGLLGWRRKRKGAAIAA